MHALQHPKLGLKPSKVQDLTSRTILLCLWCGWKTAGPPGISNYNVDALDTLETPRFLNTHITSTKFPWLLLGLRSRHTAESWHVAGSTAVWYYNVDAPKTHYFNLVSLAHWFFLGIVAWIWALFLNGLPQRWEYIWLERILLMPKEGIIMWYFELYFGCQVPYIRDDFNVILFVSNITS